jgi:insulysin
VSNDHLEGALDRFVQFFIAPLLKESSAEKEMNAVDSEFKMGMQNDQRRIFVMEQDLANKDSQLNRFNTGNLDTLKQDGIRDILLNYHKTWYSSNIMKLTVSGKHSLEQLEKWAVEMFTPVPNKDVTRPDYCKPVLPYTHDNLGRLVKFRPIQDHDKLFMQWWLPCMESEYKTQPLKYFSNLFGHEGENSLLSYLKQEGYALTLSSGSYHWFRTQSDFSVTINLTKKGLENYELVAQAVFKYAQRLCEVGPQEYVHEECKKLG